MSSLFDYEKKNLKQKAKTKILLIFQSWSQYWSVDISKTFFLIFDHGIQHEAYNSSFNVFCFWFLVWLRRSSSNTEFLAKIWRFIANAMLPHLIQYIKAQAKLYFVNIARLYKTRLHQINPSKYCLWRIKSPFAFQMVFSNVKLSHHGIFWNKRISSLQKPTRHVKEILVVLECESIWYYVLIYEIALKSFLICFYWILANNHGDISPWNMQVNTLYRYELSLFKWITYYQSFFFVRVMK